MEIIVVLCLKVLGCHHRLLVTRRDERKPRRGRM
jgi:hypothetical protein